MARRPSRPLGRCSTLRTRAPGARSMSAVPEALPLQQRVPPAPHDPSSGAPGTRHLSRSAKAYIALLGGGTLAAVTPLYARAPASRGDWVAFALLATAATLAQLFPVPSPRGMMYHTSVVFLVAAALLLPPELLVLIPAVQTVPEWIKERHAWPTQAFNIANYTLDSLAAWEAARLVLDRAADRERRRAVRRRRPRRVPRLRGRQPRARGADPARGKRPRPAGDRPLLGRERLDRPRPDGARPLARRLLDLEPVARLRRARPARRRPPVAQRLATPGRGARGPEDRPLQRPLLRDRAHRRACAGGAVRAPAVADHGRPRPPARRQQHIRPPRRRRGPPGRSPEIFRDQLRHYDIPARFGGEEFSILLPETAPQDAHEIAERIRRAVAEHAFEVETAVDPLRVTVSIGRRVVPRRRRRRERAHPPGRPRRVPGEAAGPKPGARGERRAAAARKPARPRAPPPGRAERRGRGHARSDALAGARDRRSPRSAGPASRTSGASGWPRSPGPWSLLVAAVGGLGTVAGLAGLLLPVPGQTLGLLALVALVAGGEALSFELAEVEGAISVGTRRCARRRGALRLPRRAPARDHDRRRPLERPPHTAPARPLLGRNALALGSRRRRGVLARRRLLHRRASSRRRRSASSPARPTSSSAPGSSGSRQPPNTDAGAGRRLSCATGLPRCCRTISSTG